MIKDRFYKEDNFYGEYIAYSGFFLFCYQLPKELENTQEESWFIDLCKKYEIRQFVQNDTIYIKLTSFDISNRQKKKIKSTFKNFLRKVEKTLEKNKRCNEYRADSYFKRLFCKWFRSK